MPQMANSWIDIFHADIIDDITDWTSFSDIPVPDVSIWENWTAVLSSIALSNVLTLKDNLEIKGTNMIIFEIVHIFLLSIVSCPDDPDVKSIIIRQKKT